MFDRSKFLLIFGEDAEKWAARYDIEPFSHPCGRCKRILTTTIPFACGQFRGLIAPQCACGNERPPCAIVRDPRYGDLFTGDRQGEGPKAVVGRRRLVPSNLRLVGKSDR